jgi:Flp pilus assembly protein TadD
MGALRKNFIGKAVCGAALLAAALTLGACQKQTAGLDADPISTASTGGEPSFKRTEQLSKQWTADQGNVQVGLAYAENLEKLGQKDAKTQVLRTLAAKHPENGQVQGQLGKQFLISGLTADAIEALEKSAAAPGATVQVYSALGSAYDQQGRYDIARQKYATALQLKPGDVSVTNNLAMSHALEGKLPRAEELLRQALAQPGSREVPRIRQNLALVVGLQGRFDEARKIASEDLPPDQVEANLAYLQQMLSQPNTWQQLSDKQG